jgi:hypothetical protein
MDKYKFSTLFRYLFLGYSPIALLSVILAVAELVPVGINGKDTYGWQAVVTILVTTRLLGILAREAFYSDTYYSLRPACSAS